MSINVPVDRQRFPTPFPVVAATSICERHGAGKTVLAQEEQEIKLALDLHFALYFVDLDEKFALGGFEQVMGVDGPFRNLSRRGDSRKGVIGGYLVQFPL